MNEEWKKARRRSLNNRELLLAISDNNYEEISRLINESVVDINFKHPDGYTALSLAVECGDVKVIQLLINKGADLNFKNTNDETLLDIAKRAKRSEILNLLESIANQNLESVQKGVTKISITQNDQKSQRIPESIQSDKQDSWINPVHGHIFQLKILMLFLHRGVACKYSFRLGTEIKKARKFDDLVFEYHQGNTTIYRLLQAKHKIDEKKKITIDKLLSETKGDYNLVKYFHSYQDCKRDKYFKNGVIKDVTICTNIDFDFDDLKKYNIEIEKIKDKDDILDVKSETKQPMRYKFNNSIVAMLKKKLQSTKLNIGCQVHDVEIEDFLQHLVFAVNLPNEEELGSIVKNEIGKELDFITTENAYNKFLVKMLDWMKDKSRFMSYNEGKELFDEMKKGSFLWYNIQDPVQSFTGRQEKLEDMHKLLQSSKSSVVCISGLGGVGKSELVKKYVSEYSQNYDNKIVWINAESYQTLVDSFHTLACDKLDISTTNANGKDKKINSLVTEVYTCFSKSKSLFIFDNSEMYQNIDRFLPTLPNDCIRPNIIITSRNQKWPKKVKLLLLDGFTEDEAKTFITSYLHLSSDDQKDDVYRLGKILQFLPLALQQAVAYINAQKSEFSKLENNYQIKDYFASFSLKSKEFLSFQLESDCDNKYSKTVLSTWNITLDVLKRTENGRYALELLNIMAYLLPDNISIELLSSLSKNAEMLLPSLDLLKQYSLINVHHKVVSIHRLVQQVTRLKLVECNQEESVLADFLTKIVWAKQPIVNFRNVDHFLSIWKYVKKHDFIFKDFNQAISIIIRVLITCKRNEEAYSISVENINLLYKLPGNDRDSQYIRMAAKMDIANVLMSDDKCEEALKEYKKIYEAIKDKRFGKLMLDLRSNIADTYQKLNRHTEARKWQEDVLKDCKVLLGENHPETWLTRLSISDLLVREGKHNEALSIQQEILGKQEAFLGSNHPHTLDTKLRVAHLYVNVFGKLDEAKILLEEIYKHQSSILIEHHPNILCTKNTLADIFVKQEKFDAALKIYEEVHQIQKIHSKVNDSEMLETRYKIGLMHFYKKDFDKSLNVLTEVLEHRDMILGKDHPITNMTRDQISIVLFEQQMHSSGKKVISRPTESIEDPISAIKKDNLTELKRLLEKGVDINTADENQGTLLHHAVNLNQPKTIRYLLNNGADVCRMTTKGNTPLHMATSKGFFEVVKELISHVSKDKLQEFIDAKTTNTGSTALHVAAKSGFGVIVMHLLSQGATYDVKNQAGKSALGLASNEQVKVPLKKVKTMFECAKSGSLELYNDLKRCPVVEYLTMINARNSQGYNLLQVAVLNNREELVDLIQELRSSQFRSIYTDISNLKPMTANTGKSSNNLSQARSFVKAFKADENTAFNPNICAMEDMLKLLESNERSKFSELAKRVVGAHIVLLKNSIEIHKNTAMLFEAIKNADLTAVKNYIWKGANVSAKNNEGLAALHLAAHTSNEKMVKLLLDKGAKAYATTSLGVTPLHIATKNGDAEVVKLLLKSDSSVSFVDAQTELSGSTAFHIAAKNNHSHIFGILFEHGANPLIKDKDGKNAGDLVTLEKFEE